MTRKILTTVMALSFGSFLAGCGTNVDYNPPNNYDQTTPTPTPASGSYNLTVDGTSFSDHNAQTVLVRVVSGSNVVACSEDVVVSGGTFEATFEGVLIHGADHTVEIVANTDDNGVYNSGVDRTYRVQLEGVTEDVVATADATLGEDGIGWPINTACP